MNKEVYRYLDDEEIVTKDHYRWNNDKLVLLPSNDSFIGKKVCFQHFYEKVSLKDFRPLNNNEIVNDEHFYFFRDSDGYLMMYRCYFRYQGRKAEDVRKANSSFPEFNLYAKKETQFNFETLNILKDIEL
jgi:hypothetical protein